MTLQIHTQVITGDEGTSFYRKFLTLDGVIIGEVQPSAYDGMRYKECFNEKEPSDENNHNT